MAAPHHVADVAHRIGFNEPLRQWCGLNEEKPVPISARKRIGRLLIHGERRRNVEKQQLRHVIGVVERQSMGHPRAAVMRGNAECLKTQMAHQSDQICCHRALRVCQVIGIGGMPF